MANQLILNIPHASSFIPKEDLESVFFVHGKDLKKELLNMTDWYTDELFMHGIGKEIVAKVSRLVCDTERFSHDEQESMSEKGMGFCYRCGYNNARFNEVREDMRYLEENLKEWYPGKKSFWLGLAKADDPMFSQGVVFATPFFLRDLDKLKTDDSDRLQSQKDAT